MNITEFLSDHEFVSGCVTTDNITGATPASFYAHQKDRDYNLEIAKDLLGSKLSLFIGGGAIDFHGLQLSKHFEIVQDLSGLGKSKAKKIGHFISEGDTPSIMEGRGPILAQATKEGLQFLNNKKRPFFLLVEGAKIDSYGHENNVEGIVLEGIDFDKAVAEALKFADSSGNTLVIITADHETSGFSIPQGSLENHIIEGDFTTHDHTATMVPIFAYGPHSQEFQGVYENSDIFKKIQKILSIKAQ